MLPSVVFVINLFPLIISMNNQYVSMAVPPAEGFIVVSADRSNYGIGSDDNFFNEMPSQNTMIIPILPWTLRYYRHNARSITLPKEMATKTLENLHIHQRTGINTAVNTVHEHLPVRHIVTRCRCTLAGITNKYPYLQHWYVTCNIGMILAQMNKQIY